MPLTDPDRITRIMAVASSRIVLILPEDLLKSLSALAHRKGLSRASYIRMALTEHVDVESEPSLAQALRSPRALAQYLRESTGGTAERTTDERGTGQSADR